MPRAILHAQSAECPGQRIAAIRIDIGGQRFETRAFGQKVAPADAMADRGIAPLQKRHCGIDRGEITVEFPIESLHPRAALFLWQGFDALANRPQSVTREQAQNQRQRQILLCGVKPARAQETRQVSGRRIGRIELRHRRDDGQDAPGIHHCLMPPQAIPAPHFWHC